MNTTNKSFLIPLLLLILIGITFPIHGASLLKVRNKPNTRNIKRQVEMMQKAREQFDTNGNGGGNKSQNLSGDYSDTNSNVGRNKPQNSNDDTFNAGGNNKIISKELNEHNKNLQETEQNEVKFLFWVWFAAAIATCYVWFGFETSIKRFCWTSRICGICFFIFIILSIIDKTMAWWSIFISLGLWILFAILHENAKEKEQKKE